MLSTALLGSVLVFAYLVHAAIPFDKGLSPPEIANAVPTSLSQYFVDLYKKLQSCASPIDYHAIVATNPVPWKGFENYPRQKLIHMFANRIDKMDFTFLVQTYKACRDSGELNVWWTQVKNVCKDNTPKEIEFTISASSLKSNGTSDIGLTEHDFDVILKCTYCIADHTNLSGVFNYVGRDGYIDEEEYGLAAFEDRTALIGLLKCQNNLMEVLIHALTATSSKASFIDNILPMLDENTLKSFLHVLNSAEHGGPFSLSTSRLHYQFEAEPRAVNGSENAGEKSDKFADEGQNGENSARGTDIGAYNCGIDFDNIFGDELVETILSLVEWKTLMQSAPYVSKRFRSVINDDFLIKHSTDLERYVREQSKDCHPYHVYLNYPWNRFFQTPNQLIKYHVLKCQQSGHEISLRWLICAHYCITANETNTSLLRLRGAQDYPGSELLKASLLAELEEKDFIVFDDDISDDGCVLIMDILLETCDFEGDLLEKVCDQICFRSYERLLYLLAHSKYGAKLFQTAKRCKEVIGEEWVQLFDFSLAVILVLDDFKVSADVEKEVKEYVAEIYGKTVSVPMTKEQLRVWDDYRILDVIYERSLYEETDLAYKLAIELFKVDTGIESPNLWVIRMDQILAFSIFNYLISVDPTAMSVKQFERFFNLVGIQFPVPELIVLASDIQTATQNPNNHS